MSKQLHTLLEDSQRFYRRRNLKKALNTAQIALGFGKHDQSGQVGLANACLIMANVYNTNGNYRNDASFYEKAVHSLGQAKAINTVLNEPQIAAEIQIIEGKIHLNRKAFELASECFQSANHIAEKHQILEQQVKAIAGYGHVCLAKNNIQLALEQAQELENLLKETHKSSNPYFLSELYRLFSQANILRQDYSKSLEMSQELLQVSRLAGDIEKEVIALRNIAVVCGVKSNYKIGMQYFLEALDKCDAIGYREMSVQIQINIGTLYAHLYNYEEAIRRYENVLGNYHDVIDAKTKTVVFNNLGNIYLTSDQPETALDFFENAHRLSQEHDFKDLLAYSLAQLSRTNITLEQFEAATEHANLAQALFDEHSLVNGKQINMLNLAGIAFHEKRCHAAVELAMQAAELSQLLKDDTAEIKAYKLLAKIFKQKGMFEQAFEYQERYSKIQEDFAKLQRTRHNLDMEIRHAIREKQKEIELLTKENEYQSQLIEKSDRIAKQNEELLRANDDLRQFAYIASHDLKEPLRMIGSFTQVIHKLAKPHLKYEDHEYFKYVGEGVRRMNDLLDGLLRYSTINQSQEEFTDVEINEVVTLSMANLKIRIIETEAVIETGNLPVLRGTQHLYVQLFQNLFANAIKFVQPGKQPYIKVTAEETPDANTIHVTDNGIGISEENQAKIFEIFKRLHHKSEYEGTGIGLAICQKIAKRLGGTIQVKSALGQGATFSLVLPKAKLEN
ncbi:MAG: ATP-binding protein [Saprospiraceae bacterium]|jgi:signal transduction histidine kinase/tetratricopeptide (TPR) repeat protein|nr:ATP-binding protein [Saprospiraceae bacterium]